MMEFWKRQEKYHAKEWGMSGRKSSNSTITTTTTQHDCLQPPSMLSLCTEFESLEEPRPQFNQHPKVSFVPSEITGLPNPYYSPRAKRSHVVISWVFILLMIAIVLASVFSIFILRVFMVQLEKKGSIPSVCVCVCVYTAICQLAACG